MADPTIATESASEDTNDKAFLGSFRAAFFFSRFFWRLLRLACLSRLGFFLIFFADVSAAREIDEPGTTGARDTEGWSEGDVDTVGLADGDTEGCFVGLSEGTSVGNALGTEVVDFGNDGMPDGNVEGIVVGGNEIIEVGTKLGSVIFGDLALFESLAVLVLFGVFADFVVLSFFDALDDFVFMRPVRCLARAATFSDNKKRRTIIINGFHFGRLNIREETIIQFKCCYFVT